MADSSSAKYNETSTSSRDAKVPNTRSLSSLESDVRVNYLSFIRECLEVRKQDTMLLRAHKLIKETENINAYSGLAKFTLDSLEDYMSCFRAGFDLFKKTCKEKELVILIGKKDSAITVRISDIYNQILEEEEESKASSSIRSDHYLYSFGNFLASVCYLREMNTLAEDIIRTSNNEVSAVSSAPDSNGLMDILRSYATPEAFSGAGKFLETCLSNNQVGEMLRREVGDAGSFQGVVDSVSEKLDSGTVRERLLSMTRSLAETNNIEELAERVKGVAANPREIIDGVVEVVSSSASSTTDTEVDGYRKIE